MTFVIMAGGRGERLWPLVRKATPKVCLSPNGTGMSLLRATIERLRPAWPGAQWLIVTTEGQAHAVRACLPAGLRQAVLVEPQIKNTAACITLAAVALQAPERVMVAVPADHWIENAPAFQQAVRAGIRAAVAHETIATIGIRPTHPHPGLGYLCVGETLSGGRRPRVFRLSRFIEKPSPALATRLIAQRRVYWNSGTFIGPAATFLACVTRWLPGHARRLMPLTGMWSTPQGAKRMRAAYQALEAVSFDHGVMDHLRTGIVVEGDFGWADLGSWDVWARLSPAAASFVGVNSRNIGVVSQERHVVATIGLRDLLVVHSPSATLICPRDKAQAVRDVVRRLSAHPRLKAWL